MRRPVLYLVVCLTTVSWVHRASIEGVSQSRRAQSQSPSAVRDAAFAVVSTLTSEADALSSQETSQNLKNAESKYAAALATLDRFKQHPRFKPYLINVLIGRGRTLNDMNRGKSALFFLTSAVEHAPVGDQKALAYSELARSYLAVGDSSRAIAAITTARDSAVTLSVRKTVSKVEADLHYQLNNYQKALHLAESALAETPDNPRDLAHWLILLGYVQSDLSNSDQAMSAYDRALKISNEVNYRVGVVDALTYIGHLHAKEGRLQQAFDYYEKAEPAARALGDALRQSWITSGIAYVYEQIGNPQRALEYYQQTLQLRLSIQNIPAEGSIYRRLGAQYLAMQEYAKAKSYFEKAVKLYELVNQPRYLAVAYRDLGRTSEAEGDYAEAEDYYARSQRFMQVADDPRSAAYLHVALGRLFAKQNQFSNASREYSLALSLHRAVRDRRGEAEALFQLSLLSEKQDQLETSRSSLERVIAIDETLRFEIQGSELRAAHLADVRRHYEAYIRLLMTLSRRSGDKSAALMALHASERSRARSLLEGIAESRIDIRNGVDASILEQERKIGEQLDRQARELMGLDRKRLKEDELSRMNAETERLTAQYEELQGRIRAHSPQYKKINAQHVLNAAEIQQLLDSDTVLLEYAICDDVSYLWAVSPNGVQSFELPGRTKIEAAARAVYESLVRMDRTQHDRSNSVALDEQFVSSAKELSDLLLAPVAGLTTGKKLLIVADGVLQYVPFAALPDPISSAEQNNPNAPELLGAAHEIIIIPSASVIALQRQRAASQPQSLAGVAVFADPIFDRQDQRIGGKSKVNRVQRGPSTRTMAASSQGLPTRSVRKRSGFQRLVFSGREAAAIIATAPEQERFKAIGFAANRNAATSGLLSRFRFIHFATHSFIDDEHPELSGIVLSLFDERGNAQDGFLKLHDIYKLSLPADLVVLSACETALGKNIRGEGLMGMTRAFMHAGAARVVASLWKVDDAATAELMSQFYEEMFTNGKRPAAALQIAQREIAKQKRWSHPYFWAGFVLQGEWR
jgi:CHAT domain-containing protein/tetratricopeptide (TPR) repeat protein